MVRTFHIQVAAHYIGYWKELWKSAHNYYLLGVLQQIIDNCVGGADEDLEMLRACVTELTTDVLPQQQSQEEEEEEENSVEVSSLQEHQKENEWEGLNDHQKSLDSPQRLFDHVSTDYVITRDDDEPAVLLPTDTTDDMGADISVVTKSSGAILIESSLLPEVSHELPELSHELPEVSHELPELSHELPELSHELPEVSHELPELSHEHQEVPLSSYKTLDGSHDQIDGSHDQVNGSHNQVDLSHDQVDGSHDQVDGSHDQVDVSHDQVNGSHDQVNESHNQVDEPLEPHERSHDLLQSANEPLEISMDKSHKLVHEPVDESHDLLDESRIPVYSSHDLLEGSCDHLTSQDQVTEIDLESHDLFSESHDLIEPLFDDEEISGTYRHRSLTAASVSNTAYISLASTGGHQDNSFEAIPLTTGSKKKRTKKSGKKKRKQDALSTDIPSIAPLQPPPPPTVQEELLQPLPAKSEYICIL